MAVMAIAIATLLSFSAGVHAATCWTTTWATSPQKCPPQDMPKQYSLDNSSLRQVVKVSLGGETLRLRLSNLYSDSTLSIKSVYIAPARGGWKIDAAGARYLAFGGKKGVEIAAGGEAWSDPLKFDLQPLEEVSITINYARSPRQLTQHSGSRTTSYIIPGETTPENGNFADAEKIDHWYNICSIDVDRCDASAIAILGNSITDGRGSTTNMQNRWPDILSRELGGNTGVLNFGIGANCVLSESIGAPGIKRFDTDVMGQSGVKTIIIFEGINDIGGSRDADKTAGQLIEAYKGFVKKAHAAGITIIGATITPIKYTDYDSPEHERCRQMVNDWIRNGGEFDAVIDFDRLLADPVDPNSARRDILFDNLHPNAAGYEEMGREAARVIKGETPWNPRALWLQSLPLSPYYKVASPHRTANVSFKGKIDKVTEEEIRRVLAAEPLIGLKTKVIISKTGNLKKDGFSIKRRGNDVTLTSPTGAGALYGAFAMLRYGAQGKLLPEDITDNPAYDLRILNHWDNPDGTIERGYAGKSLWRWDELPALESPRYREYARSNASIGINGAVLNNVNASPTILKSENLEKVRVLADIFRPYGIKVYLSVNFASPMVLDSFPTADPLDSSVAQWWKDKAAEIYKLIPDFGGFLVKANSEGQPGPMDFGRTHADGANMLASALKPHGGIVMWRAFVYSPDDDDRAKQAYREFTPLDGKFADNVIIQIKNGPIDFQPREPYSPLFGAMPATRQMVEFQVTQEYLGHSNHMVYLAPMWKEFFSYVPSESLSAVAGVSNVGSDNNWTGHPMAAANWYAFGRLAWNPDLEPGEIADEWLSGTLPSKAENSQAIPEDVKAGIARIMLDSREAAVDYMMPLGLHHIFAGGHHYGPEPWYEIPGGRRDWMPRYYHQVDSMGIGFNRSPSGSDAVSQYPAELASRWGSVETCPDEYALWFHHLPWTHRMQSGDTLWEALCRAYQRGYDKCVEFQKVWDAAEPWLPEELYEEVARKLMTQTRDAKWWGDACILYFGAFSKLPLPSDVDAPLHTLKDLQKVNLGISNYENPSPALLDSKR